MRKTAVLRKLRDQEAELRRLGIESLSVFGSVARDEDDDSSDIDLAVKLNPVSTPSGFAYFGLLHRLESRLREVLGRNVDVVAEPVTKPAMQLEIDRDRAVAF